MCVGVDDMKGSIVSGCVVTVFRGEISGVGILARNRFGWNSSCLFAIVRLK